MLIIVITDANTHTHTHPLAVAGHRHTEKNQSIAKWNGEWRENSNEIQLGTRNAPIANKSKKRQCQPLRIENRRTRLNGMRNCEIFIATGNWFMSCFL